MTDLRPDGLYECNSCKRTYDSEISLMWCCLPDEDDRDSRRIQRSTN